MSFKKFRTRTYALFPNAKAGKKSPILMGMGWSRLENILTFLGQKKSLHKKQRKPNLYFGSVISSPPPPFPFLLSRFRGKKRRRGLRHANPKQGGRSGRADSKQCKGKRVFQFATPFVFPSPPGFLFLSYFAESPQKTKREPHTHSDFLKGRREKVLFFWEYEYPFIILSFTS